MKDKKEIILKDIFTIIDENLFKHKIFSKCNVNLKKQDLNLMIESKFNKKDTKILQLKSLSENLDEKAVVIKNAEEKYNTPNITTQVYQIALFNTLSSIKDNPLDGAITITHIHILNM